MMLDSLLAGQANAEGEAPATKEDVRVAMTVSFAPETPKKFFQIHLPGRKRLQSVASMASNH